MVRHKLVEMHRQVEVAKTYTRAVAARHVAGEDVVAEACLAKQTAVDTADVRLPTRPSSSSAATGYMHGTEVERHYRDARILRIGGGATEVLTDLAARLLGYALMSANREAMLAKLAELDAEHAKAVAGGGEKYVDRHHARGKLLPRERIELLIDEGCAFLELSPARRLGLRLHRRGVRGHRHRRHRGRRVHDHRQRPHGEGRRQQPVDGEEDLPRLRRSPRRTGCRRSRWSSPAARTCRRRRRSSSPAASCSATSPAPRR